MLVEDDLDLARELSKVLEKWGLNLFKIEEFDNILGEFINIRPQLVIMDVNLPFYDGFYWCKKIREISKAPILFLSSRDSNMDLVMGINNGGDDYITKPFSTEVLISKISALLRRTYDYSNNSESLIYYNNLILDIERCVFIYENDVVELTKNEMKILSILLKNKGKVVSRNKMMMSLWSNDEFVNDNTLTVNVNRLRKKFEELGAKGYLKTKRGQGYILICD